MKYIFPREAKMRLQVLTVAVLLLAGGSLGAQNVFGAFQVQTYPQDAVVTLYGTNQYLGNTPTSVFPVMMDQFMTYYYGTPGRAFSLLISKPGFISMKQDIFVPYNKVHQVDAMREPTVYSFYLSPAPVCPPPYWQPPSPPYYPNPPQKPWHSRPHGRPHRH